MKIQIFTVGGTIDKIYFDAKSEYEVGEPNIDWVLGQLNVGFQYAITSLMRKDSLDMDDEDRRQVLAAVQACPLERILITHGTDTMADTGRVLSAVTDKTIVLTGAMQPAKFVGSDAMFNIGFALGALQALPHGVYIAMNGRIFDPRRVVKNREAGRFEDAGEGR
ncbi:MAG TPA: asparaginase domain-containing protein [Candidatus Competibacteraceae bacterium]|nr:asparaginase domain-containing protein [Candidatus Competibacteraceae bacterium]